MNDNLQNLTLTAKEFEQQRKAFAMAVLIAVALLLFLRRDELDQLGLTDIARMASSALVGVTLLFWAFYKWCWRWGRIPRWIGRPSIHGVWIGSLSSDFGRDKGELPLVVPIAFVVRQSYLTLSIQSFTATQTGESKVEALMHNARTDATRLAYVFELKNEYPGESSLVHGAGDLLLASGDNVLQGHYWTSTPSNGNLRLRRVCADCGDLRQFDDITARWPVGRDWPGVFVVW
jgi:hypothetical protein